MSENKYWHQQDHKKKKGKFTYLATIFVALVIVGGLYYAGTYKGRSTIRGGAVSSDIIEGLIESTSGVTATVEEVDGEGIRTANYISSGITKDELIAATYQFLTNENWTINSGKEARGGRTFVISASEKQGENDLQIYINVGDFSHDVSVIYSQ